MDPHILYWVSTMSKEEFKNYVRNNPYIKQGVDEGKITWQKAYESFDLYGSEAEELRSLQPSTETVPEIVPTAPTNTSSLSGINPLLLSLTTLDWGAISHTVDNLSRMVSMAKDVVGKGDVKSEKANQVFRRYND